MRPLTNAVVVASMLLVSSGCIIVAEGSTETGSVREWADLTVFYSFDNQILESAADCDVIGLATIVVDIEGVNVSDGSTQTKRCARFYQGMTVSDLTVGDYDVMVRGLDATGEVIYSLEAPKRTRVRVRSGGEIDVDAKAMFGSLTVFWSSFGDMEGAGRCYDAGVDAVRAVLYAPDGRLVSDEVFDCEHEGIVWDYLPEGTWEVVLNGLDADGYAVFAGEAFLNVFSGRHDEYDVPLDMIVGDLSFYWTFEGSARCEDVAAVQVYLYDPWDELYDGFTYDCSLGGLTYAAVVEGEWLVELVGLDSRGRVIYRTDSAGVLLDVFAGTHAEYFVDLN